MNRQRTRLVRFERAPLNIGARIVRVQEECGSLMLDDHETGLYDAVQAFAGGLWSDEPMPEPDDTPVIERVMFDEQVRGTADLIQHQRRRE